MEKANFGLNTVEIRKVSERTLIVEDIWKLYDTEQEENLRKAYNKKNKKNVKKLTPAQVAVKTAHLNKAELEYMLSECKRKSHQGYSIGSYLLFNGLK